jgi:glycine/D-amino acid oxidase-like deaminating enzyme
MPTGNKMAIGHARPRLQPALGSAPILPGFCCSRSSKTTGMPFRGDRPGRKVLEVCRRELKKLPCCEIPTLGTSWFGQGLGTRGWIWALRAGRFGNGRD